MTNSSDNSAPLDILTELRNAAGYSLTHMARRCGLSGNQSHQTAGAWERGEYVPKETRRVSFIGYLWDDLGLRSDPARFEEVWQILVEEWSWAPIEDDEWQEHFPGVVRPSQIDAATEGETTGDQAQRDQPPPFQAPATVPHFVGRSAEIERLTMLLTPSIGSPAERPTVIALVGMGGMGKSTLATYMAHQLRDRFGHGVLWGFATKENLLDLLQSWARAYGYDFSSMSDVENRAAAVRYLLATRQALLVLDNLDSVEQVRLLLPSSNRCAVLLTTRSEEVAIGLGAEMVPLTELMPAEGMELLTHILGEERVASNLDAAREICAVLHHLPLAVEIAAQFLAARPRRTLAQMVKRLSDIGQRLDLHIHDHAVRTSFAVSWEALDAEHQETFAQLAVFAGRSFTIDAAAHVGEIDAFEAQDRLEMLKALSLLREVEVVEPSQGGEETEEAGVRYQQHPLLTDFAREKLGEETAPFLRMAAYYVTFVRQHDQEHAALEPEWGNIMAGMKTTHELAAWEMVLEYAGALSEPWLTSARYTDARRGYAWACDAARHHNRPDDLARFLCLWGTVSTEQHDYDEATGLLTESLSLAENLNLDLTIADALFVLARIEIEEARYAQATHYLDDCKSIREQWGDDNGLADVLCSQGILAYRTGEYQKAQFLAQRALAILRPGFAPEQIISTLRLLIDVELKMEHVDTALAHGQEALALAKATKHQGELGAVLYSMAVIHRIDEQYEEAERYAAEAQQFFEQMGSKAFFALTFFELSRIRQGMANYTAAQQLIEHCIGLLHEIGDEFNLVVVLQNAGDLYIELQQNNEARSVWLQAQEIASRIEHPALSSLTMRLETELPSTAQTPA